MSYPSFSTPSKDRGVICSFEGIYFIFLISLYFRLSSHSWSPEAKMMSPFVTHFGKVKFKKVPFHLAEVSTHFQQLITEALEGLSYAFGHLDDILIFSANAEEHLKNLMILFDRWRTADVQLKRKKYDFSNIDYMPRPFNIKRRCIPLPEKLQCIESISVPKPLKRD